VIEPLNLKVILLIPIFVSVILLNSEEALALGAALLISRQISHKWANELNIIFLISDLLLGGFLLIGKLGKELNPNTLAV
jgi:hypothetical protein